MNEHLLEILTKEIVASLPAEQKRLYQFIVHLEDELAEQAQTPQDFLDLIVEHSPHKQAADYFNKPYGEIIKLMRDIERGIEEKLQLKIKNAKWIDCTSILTKKRKKANYKALLYLFII